MEEDLKTKVEILEREIQSLKDEFYRGTTPTTRAEFRKVRYLNGFEIADGFTIDTGSVTGTRIGSSGDKIGFFGVTPVVRQSAISSPTGGTTVDTQARSVIDTIRTTLTTLGLTN